MRVFGRVPWGEQVIKKAVTNLGTAFLILICIIEELRTVNVYLGISNYSRLSPSIFKTNISECGVRPVKHYIQPNPKLSKPESQSLLGDHSIVLLEGSNQK